MRLSKDFLFTKNYALYCPIITVTYEYIFHMVNLTTIMVYMQQLFSTNSSRFIILSKALNKRQFFEMGYLNHLDVISDQKYIKYQKINFVKKTLIFNIFLAPPISTGNSTEGKQITGMFQSFCSLFYVVCICKKAYSLRQHQQFRYFSFIC